MLVRGVPNEFLIQISWLVNFAVSVNPAIRALVLKGLYLYCFISHY